MGWAPAVVPGTQEAEVERSLEPRSSRLQSAVIVPLHSGLGKSETLSQKNKTKKKTLQIFIEHFLHAMTYTKII